MARKSNKFALQSTVEIDVVAILDKRIKCTTMSLAEAKSLHAKQSDWNIQLFQHGFHAYKATE